MRLLATFAVVGVWTATNFVHASSPAAPCVTPSVRREWRAFSKAEKADWIRAVNCLANLPHDPALTPSVDPSISRIPPVNASGSYYDDFVYIHMDLNTQIHFTGLFLPWHRWYVWVYEQQLSSKCGYKGVSPYWDWTKDSADFFGATIFKDADPVSGLGGWGEPAHDFRVPDGGFHSMPLSYPSPHTVRRNFTLQPFTAVSPFPEPLKLANTSFTPAEIRNLIAGNVGDFEGFHKDFETFEGPHSAVHLIMGGDLGGTCPENAPADCVPGPTWSANEPLFWMHHAMVDKVWYDWQHEHAANRETFFGGSVAALQNLSTYEQYPNGAPPYLHLDSHMPTDGLFPQASIGDVIDTRAGILCYVYV
ncbi:Di-copper centre-containing protein [Auriscalpium vulgare]|uniref:Di-copper centre-containing protein n=1 Tax=Auriscalpium vulgare TaxID=40419 RepID=A0ACB8S060_9AGAM|nr:Di-copper centre-containing protein [Auriscalpium vulgare]